MRDVDEKHNSNNLRRSVGLSGDESVPECRLRRVGLGARQGVPHPGKRRCSRKLRQGRQVGVREPGTGRKDGRTIAVESPFNDRAGDTMQDGSRCITWPPALGQDLYGPACGDGFGVSVSLSSDGGFASPSETMTTVRALASYEYFA